ncbi:hypothetical protein A9Q94_09885 [Rhodobacterales bacterium 56_14_T64]|nr:hypothetical protein A9Q94_09885 [Rhodobacterales bacterium 56_14_T64]
MSTHNDLSDYIRNALKAGQSRDIIRATLLAENWTKTEVEIALAQWSDTTLVGPVPRPVRSTAAKDAFFYVLLFVGFGMVAGNTLAMLLAQVNFWIPEAGRTDRYAVSGIRWSMAAIIVFAPAFWYMNRVDNRATMADSSRSHNTIRRWLSSLAMLIAVITLMGDALYLIYKFLDGHVTARFLAKSAIVALIAGVVLSYFRQERTQSTKVWLLPPAIALLGLTALGLGLSLSTIGGPFQGKKEQRDRWRISDLRSLAGDIRNCETIDRNNLPETLDPLTCSDNPGHLTALATEITYTRIDTSEFELCIDVEFPLAISTYNIRVRDNTACLRRETN